MGFGRRRHPFQASVFGCLIAVVVIVLTLVVTGIIMVVMAVGINSSSIFGTDPGGGSDPGSAPASSGHWSSGG